MMVTYLQNSYQHIQNEVEWCRYGGFINLSVDSAAFELLNVMQCHDWASQFVQPQAVIHPYS